MLLYRDCVHAANCLSRALSTFLFTLKKNLAHSRFNDAAALMLFLKITSFLHQIKLIRSEIGYLKCRRFLNCF